MDDFIALCLELLQPLGAVRAKRMFGGHGLYVDELFIAIVARRRLYLKTDDATRPAFIAAGGEAFTFEARGKLTATSYLAVPAEAMESAPLMQPWARLALAAALRARAAKPASARRRPPASAPSAAAAVARKRRRAAPV